MEGCNFYPEFQVVGRIVCFGVYWRQRKAHSMRRARFCVGSGYEKSDAEITLFSQPRLLGGPSLGVTTISRAREVGREVGDAF